MTFDDVSAFAKSLTGVVVGERYGSRTYQIDDKAIAWERAFSKADIKRYGDETPPAGPILAITVEDLDAKDALLALELPGFFTIPHFNGYAAVLVELRKARVRDVKAAIKDAHRVLAARPAKKKRKKRSS